MMVDEFQDTNPLQVEIIKALCGDDWRKSGLFAVGDFKQSIYRFNGADPSVSTSLRAEMPPPARLSLTTNFRSQPAVLEFVNAVFHGAFDDYEPLLHERKQLTPPPAVEFLWSPGPDGDGGGPGHQATAGPAVKRRLKGAKRDARAEEAHWIARRLVQLFNATEPIVVDSKNGDATPRRLRPGDVAILLRSLSDAQVYEEALRQSGIDYYLAGGHAFYSQQEIYDILNLLRAVASSVDEIALAGALRSPLFALTDETLFWLVDRGGSLNRALRSIAHGEGAPPQLAELEADKARRAAATLARLRREKNRLQVAELLTLALELTGYDATLLAEFLGPRKAANVEKLIEQARALDRGSPGDLPGFIAQLTEFVQHAPKEALAATQAHSGDVVRIMTIHYAKGLEFPLVVLPDLERPRHPGASEPVLDPDLGPLLPAVDRKACVGFDLYRRRERLEDLEERKRLFYVACTRAADYLILSSSIDDVRQPKSDWLQLVDDRICLATGELRGALPAGYGVPQVRVITERPRVGEAPASTAPGPDLQRLVAKTRELMSGPAAPLPREAMPIPVDAGARRRFSFSQLTGQLSPADDREDHLWINPDEVQVASSPDDGAAHAHAGEAREFGRLVHAILERLDFRKPRDVRRLADFFAPRLVLHAPDKAAAAAVGMVERFLQTPLAAELAAAQRCSPRDRVSPSLASRRLAGCQAAPGGLPAGLPRLPLSGRGRTLASCGLQNEPRARRLGLPSGAPVRAADARLPHGVRSGPWRPVGRMHARVAGPRRRPAAHLGRSRRAAGS